MKVYYVFWKIQLVFVLNADMLYQHKGYDRLKLLSLPCLCLSVAATLLELSSNCVLLFEAKPA